MLLIKRESREGYRLQYISPQDLKGFGLIPELTAIASLDTSKTA